MEPGFGIRDSLEANIPEPPSLPRGSLCLRAKPRGRGRFALGESQIPNPESRSP